MIALDDYFGRISHLYVPDDTTRRNAVELLERVNKLLEMLPLNLEAVIAPKLNSGWRPAAYNATVPGAAVRSRHITGQALDLADPDGALDDYLFQRQELLVECCLWMEHPLATKNWCHLQSAPPRSGNRVFIP